MNHHRTRQFLREMKSYGLSPAERSVEKALADAPRPIVVSKPPKLDQRYVNALARDLFALGADAMIAQAKAADLDRNVRAALSDEESTEGRPFPTQRTNPHEP